MAFSIFDKFVDSHNAGSSYEIEPEQQIYHSISSHLMRLLNSRRRSLVHLPDYGIPDLAEIYQSLPYSINRLIQAIKQTIEKYEPRLTHVKVMQKSTISDEYILQLEIQGQIITGEKIQFNTFFTHDCQTKIGSEIINLE